jgi:hypothetical protein
MSNVSLPGSKNSSNPKDSVSFPMHFPMERFLWHEHCFLLGRQYIGPDNMSPELLESIDSLPML